MFRPVRSFASPRALAVLAVLALSSFPLSAARADDAAPQPVSLAPLVISATRLPTPASEIASSVTVITGEEIESKQQ
ncbi:MAG TPA: hypothetical protein VKV77_04750, partial [Methylovirgula sp.]|nr:hypothetical protein [Methylovirgula sp.]